MNKKRIKSYLPYIIGLVVFGIVLSIFVRNLNFTETVHLLQTADWHFLTIAVICTLASYSFASISFLNACRLFNLNIRAHELFSLGWVSTVLNDVTASGGVAGHSIRVISVKRKGERASKALAASVFHSYFNNLVFYGLFPIGITYVIIYNKLTFKEEIVLYVLLTIFVIALIAVTLAIFRNTPRKHMLKVISVFMKKVFKKDVSVQLGEFDISITEGLKLVRKRPADMVSLVVAILVDWGSSILALSFCFHAMGVSISPGLLIAGFTIGFTAGVLSLLPGGLGIQDGSMVGVFALLGVSKDGAILAVLLFRIVYYLLPLLISLIFYKFVLQKNTVPK